MGATDFLLQNAVELILSKLPPEVHANIATVAQSGVGLAAQLNRIEERLAVIEAHQRELALLFASLATRQPLAEDAKSNGALHRRSGT